MPKELLPTERRVQRTLPFVPYFLRTSLFVAQRAGGGMMPHCRLTPAITLSRDVGTVCDGLCSAKPGVGGGYSINSVPKTRFLID